MSEYMVRWKFGPNSLLNHLDVETSWYQTIYPNKEKALDHYISAKMNRPPSEACTIEIYELVQLIPGQEEQEKEEIVIPKVMYPENYLERNKEISRLYKSGVSRAEIAKKFDISYSAVYSVTKRY